MVTGGESPLTREQIALIEIGHTDVRPPTVRFLLGAFLLAIAAVPLFEIVSAKGLPGEVAWRSADPQPTAWRRIVQTNRSVLSALHAFEEALEDQSRIGSMLRPTSQLLMTRFLGAGNELAYVGRDGWLFYRPDVELVTGRGFLDRGHSARRVASASEWIEPPRTDPAPAILAFKRQLEARGIALVVVPTPVKPSVHPGHLTRRAASAPLPVHNASYSELLQKLRAAGVLVFDPAEPIVEALRTTGASQYLATDTHWRPETMEMVAERLAEFLRMQVSLPARGAVAYQTQPMEIQHLGDIADMLDLPAQQTLFAPEAVTIRRVVQADGSAWLPSPEADILVLGDSFSNIYSLSSMGWGDSAGFVEHVSYALQRPVDRIVQNDRGAYATRELLHRGGPERLAGKRVVIWQFAARELAFGDWKEW